jgi:hypothetical protein
MGFINNPNQFPGSGVIDLGTLSTGGLSSADLHLSGADDILLVSNGTASPSIVIKQNFAIAPHSNGTGTASLTFGTINGIQFARTEGTSSVSLHLGQEITNTVFTSAGAGNVNAFFRLNDEANVFLDNAVSAGGAGVQLNFLTEQLVFFRSNGTSTAVLVSRLN